VQIEDLHVDAEVYWNDPDEGIASGYYIVTDIISDTVIRLKNSEGSVVEVFLHELS
jgi:hypothetical protein